MELFIVLIILLLLGILIAVLIQVAAKKAENDRQPILSVSAQVVAKRPLTTGAGGVAATSYYVTFELESGDRKEFSIRGDKYGMLAERDKGILSYQGTRYRGFQRQRS